MQARRLPRLVESPQTPQVDLWEPIERIEAIEGAGLSAFGHASRDRTHNGPLLIRHGIAVALCSGMGLLIGS
jgi:hypothetical protein